MAVFGCIIQHPSGECQMGLAWPVCFDGKNSFPVWIKAVYLAVLVVNHGLGVFVDYHRAVGVLSLFTAPFADDIVEDFLPVFRFDPHEPVCLCPYFWSDTPVCVDMDNVLVRVDPECRRAKSWSEGCQLPTHRAVRYIVPVYHRAAVAVVVVRGALGTCKVEFAFVNIDGASVDWLGLEEF
ncbi:MAG: hypothetical protein BWY72_02157 [Bacteroidetes bacterium ADurb.Bin416]|nr:MAG: hypothetical protein BWY72_02157 [Bacteroidetes bacterium ADurb.Bin416]